MNRFKIGTRLAAGFGLMLLFIAVLVAVALWRMQGAAQATNEITQHRFEAERLLTQWKGFIRENAIRTKAIAKLTDAQLQREFEQEMAAVTVESAELQNKLNATLKDAEAIRLYKAALEKRAEFQKARAEAIQARFQGDHQVADQFFDHDMEKLSAAYNSGVDELVSYQQQLINDRADTLANNNETAFKLVLGIGICALVIGLSFAYAVTRSISRPLGQAVEHAKAVSNRDLTRRIEVTGNDETSALLGALRTMNSNLLNVIGRVQEGSDSIATASGQIAAGNTDLAGRTEEQASSLAETAATLEQLTTTVKQNADNAQQANQLAESAASVAMESGDVVAQVVETMKAIDESGKKVAEIVNLIDSIAFQTNILALNAAVEAARAGEQGRGFAVVASEVRALAQRSASAAKEITGLVDESVAATEQGNRLVGRAGETMKETVQSIRRVVDIMGEISSASQEQSTGIEQIHLAVSQMDQVTQQNAALVEEASVASSSMQDQAKELARLVATFKVDRDVEGTVIESDAPLLPGQPLALAS